MLLFPPAELQEGVLSPFPKGGCGGAALGFKVHWSWIADRPRTLPHTLVQFCTTPQVSMSLISSVSICSTY